MLQLDLHHLLHRLGRSQRVFAARGLLAQGQLVVELEVLQARVLQQLELRLPLV